MPERSARRSSGTADVLPCGAEQEVPLQIRLTVHDWTLAELDPVRRRPEAAPLGRVGVVTPLRLGGRLRCAGR
jgi:hypothetical protein